MLSGKNWIGRIHYFKIMTEMEAIALNYTEQMLDVSTCVQQQDALNKRISSRAKNLSI